MKHEDFRLFAQMFDSYYLDIFRIVNKMGKYDATMPDSIKRYLYELERMMFIVYVWEDGRGYEILTQRNRLQSYQQALEDRLQKHIYDRIFEIYRAMALQ
jgi:hypothetical protein